MYIIGVIREENDTMALSKIQSKKALYKKALAALLAGTMGMGIAGCSNSNEGAQPDTKEQTTEVNEDPKEEEFSLPSETMSVEETQSLEVGTEIMLADLNKMPNEATLEEMNRSTAYLVELTFTDQKGKTQDGGVIVSGLLPDGILDKGYVDELLEDGTTRRTKLVGITIAEIQSFTQDENGQWIKMLTNGEYLYEGTPVVSEKLLQQFGGPQKTK